MNPDRMKSVINNMNAMDKKVFDCVPIVEAWTIHQISTEYKRQHMVLPNYAAVEIILKKLHETGIIRKTKDENKDLFNRYAMNTKPEPKKEIMNIQIKPAVRSLQERMYDCAARLNTLSEEMASLAHEVEAYVIAPNPEMEKLQKMKELFKSLVD